jgi:hypothetical protein
MIESFLQYYDRITNYSAKGYETPEILLFLNNAQDEFVKERTFEMNFQPPAFDDNEKRAADIRPLLFVNQWEDPDGGGQSWGNNANSFPMHTQVAGAGGDPNLLYLLEVQAELTRTNPTISVSTFIPCVQIKLEEGKKFKVTEFNRPWFKYPVYFAGNNDQLIVLYDYYTTKTEKISVTYIRQPYPITEASVDYSGAYGADIMSLEPHTHQEIVDLAVIHALQSQQDPRWQTKLAEQKVKTE